MYDWMNNMKKLYLTDDHIKSACCSIMSQMYKDNFKPKYIVGITRGGLVPALYLSHMTGIPMHTLDIRLRDANHDPESNGWMPQDAFGVFQQGYGFEGDNILIVDDINDTGETFEWLIQDWQNNCLPTDERWEEVWGESVRFATVIENMSSKFGFVNYHEYEVNKAEDDLWVVFPWEEPLKQTL